LIRSEELDLPKLCNQNNADEATKIDRQMELGDCQSWSKNQQIDDLNRQNSAEQIDLNNKFRRDKPDESDTKMIRINVIQRGFRPNLSWQSR
jgi:hypothetical protein